MDENRNPMAHSPLGKRKALPNDSDDPVQGKRSRVGGAVTNLNDRRNGVSALQRTSPEVAGRIAGIELENFMCHGKLVVEFNVRDNNCFYIGGPNGSGKSALFAAMNIGLGGRGNHNDRGNSVKGYIKEGQTRAKIRVILTNKGEGHIDKYGDFIVVERTINQSASTYSLKSQTNSNRESRREVVSTKKADLDAILARFGIELNNPIYWMSQDRSRHFLQKMDPPKLYEIFMKATELESTAESYRKCEEIHDEIHKILSDLKKDIGDQQKEIEKWKDDKNRVKKEIQLRKEVDQLLFYSQWAPVRDAELDLKHWERMKTQIENLMAGVNQKKYQNGVDQAHARSQLDELSKKITEHKGVVDQYRNEIRAFEEELRIQKKEANVVEGRIRKIEGDIRIDEDRISEAEDCIEEAVRRAETNEGLKELTAFRHKLDRLKQKEVDVSDQRRAVEREIQDIDNEREKMEMERREAKGYYYEMSGKYSETKTFVEKYEAIQKDKMARFGDKTALIMQLVQRNCGRFEKQPKGPLGMYISVKNSKWLLAVEEALKSYLSCFIFNSKRDSDEFTRIIREANSRGASIPIPNTIVTRFGLSPHNTAQYEPKADYKTVLREIDIADVDVKNAFIDLCGIESHLLFETDAEARQVMYGNCPAFCQKAQVATGAQVFGSNQSGGQYRYYGCKKLRAVILTSRENNYDKKALQQEFEIICRKRELAGKKVQEIDINYSEFRKTASDLEQKKKTLESELYDLKEQIRKGNLKLENLEEQQDDDQKIDNLRATISTLEDRVHHAEEAKKGLTDQLKEIQKKMMEKEGERDATSDEMKDYVADFMPAEDEVLALSMKIKAYARTDEDCVETLKRMKRDLEDNEQKRVERLKTLETARKRAQKYKEDNPGSDDAPDLDTLPETEYLVKEHIEKEAAYKALRNQIVNLPTNEQMAEKKEYYHKAKLLYTQLRMLFLQIKECFDIRKKSFPVVRAAITMRLMKTFRRLIKIRFTGTLEVDDDKKEIRISVQPHKTANEGVQDLKGLSGGERSYTTACFVMSLWDIMEAPFRCMDEFDVFMDMINRKVVMDLLVRLATEEYPHHQFLFFTPQGINELGEKNRVQIYEMPKVRP